MGWAIGTNADGRKIGYAVRGTCDQPGCDEEINHGLAYVCGGMHDGGEYGCGRYFCDDHLSYVSNPKVDGMLCPLCSQAPLVEWDEDLDS